MRSVVSIWKPIGLTPLEIVDKFKERYPEFKNETISYAGRLDPMAEGILLLLVGEENKNRDKYLNFKKEYESEIILGISTDTFDSLGIITSFDFKEITKIKIENCLKTFVGKQKQIYPPFSSRAVKGKSLYWWFRQGRINEIEIPERNIEIYSIELINSEKINCDFLVSRIIENVDRVSGDFRQNDIISSWKKFGKENKDDNLIKIKIKVLCSSGTYVRRVADDLGKRLGIEAFAYSIKRTRIGNISEQDAIIL